jgi:hypothetical protein
MGGNNKKNEGIKYISKKFTLDRSAWKKMIYASEP